MSVPQAAGVLIAFSGLPGTGKSSIARSIASKYGAVYVRIDTIEQALRRANPVTADIGPEGYAVAYALAEDNLRLGNIVVADSVNPLFVTREAWRAVAARAGAPIVEVEICCSDSAEHRRRVESRSADVEGLVLPTWQDVLNRTYESWDGERIVIDAAHRSVDACIAVLDQHLRIAITMR